MRAELAISLVGLSAGRANTGRAKSAIRYFVSLQVRITVSDSCHAIGEARSAAVRYAANDDRPADLDHT